MLSFVEARLFLDDDVIDKEADKLCFIHDGGQINIFNFV